MKDNDSIISKGPLQFPESAPAIILINPQMGENIGAAARIMANFGLRDLRIVAPRDGWPNPRALEMARNAKDIVESARIFDTTEEAVEDLQHLYAATARPREMVKPVVTPREAATTMVKQLGVGQVGHCGFVFGPEKAGLENKDIILSDAIITIPVHPGYTSLNLAQSVAILCYEYFIAQEDGTPVELASEKVRPASKKEITGFLGHLEGLLDEKNFFKVPEKRDKMLQNINNLFIRTQLNEQDVRTLRGILTALVPK